MMQKYSPKAKKTNFIFQDFGRNEKRRITTNYSHPRETHSATEKTRQRVKSHRIEPRAKSRTSEKQGTYEWGNQAPVSPREQ